MAEWSVKFVALTRYSGHLVVDCTRERPNFEATYNAANCFFWIHTKAPRSFLNHHLKRKRFCVLSYEKKLFSSVVIRR